MLTDITIEHDWKVHHYEVTIRVARPNNNPFTSLETAARAQKKYEQLENLRSIVISPGRMVDKETDKTLTYLRGIMEPLKADFAIRELGVVLARDRARRHYVNKHCV